MIILSENQEKEMTNPEAILDSIPEGYIPKKRRCHILKALEEVELILSGELPYKSAIELLKELEEQS